MEVVSIRTPGLGDATYLAVHDGHAVVVDPQRDIARFVEALGDAEAAFVFETHLHNDYVSGGRELAAATGAELVLPAAAAAAYRHTPAFHTEELRAGPFTVTPLHTPGHTPEHTSYLVAVDGEEAALFSGGSLLVGSAGRPDLLGEERADTLARLQYISVNRLAALPEETGLFPTHGEGSFCTATGAGRATSTIGAERKSNPVLLYPDVDAFVDGQLAGLQPYPAYYALMGPANLYGYGATSFDSVPVLAAEQVAAMDDVTLIDVRSKEAFAGGHIPGSIGLEAGDQVGVWAGWLVPHHAQLVLIADADQDAEPYVTQLRQIGMDNVLGLMRDIASWPGELASYRIVSVDDAKAALANGNGMQIVDVRAPNEWEQGALPGSILSYLPDVARHIPGGLDASRPVWLVCRTGYRATAAAKFVEEAGYEPIVLAGGGVPDLVSS